MQANKSKERVLKSLKRVKIIKENNYRAIVIQSGEYDVGDSPFYLVFFYFISIICIFFERGVPLNCLSNVFFSFLIVKYALYVCLYVSHFITFESDICVGS